MLCFESGDTYFSTGRGASVPCRDQCRIPAPGVPSVPFSTAEDLQSNGKFDQAFCIILDINLGHGSGIELRHHLAVAGVTVPIIYITGNYSEATRMAAIESGCLAYLTKPFTATSLIEAVENASTIFA